MINLELVKRNAEKLNKNGLEKTVLAKANKIYETSLEIAKSSFGDFTIGGKDLEGLESQYEDLMERHKNNKIYSEKLKQYKKEDLEELKRKKESFFKNHKSHINPETIATYISILGDDLKGLNFLDLGAGTGDYLPILSIAMKEMGANVSSVDMKEGCKELEELGINYKGIDLSYFGNDLISNYIKEKSKDFCKNQDIISARSFLGGGFSRGNYMERISNNSEEFSKYKQMVDFMVSNNGKPALFELDTVAISPIEGMGEEEFLESKFGKTLCGYKDGIKPFYLFEK